MTKGKGRNPYMDKVMAGFVLAIVLILSWRSLNLFVVLIIGIVGYFIIQWMYAGGRSKFYGQKQKSSDTTDQWFDVNTGALKKHRRKKTKG